MGTNAPLLDISEDKVVEFETVVMKIPQFEPEHPKMISQGPSLCIFNKNDSQEVLASWLFMQYLLTNEVQIAYSETEGYVPVTLKAQQSAEYQDYLARCGEDNELHYEVKIKAAELLLNNVENTFVTPVFNGSASLRDAAGGLIENTVKSVRRGQEINDAYLEKLYADTMALYRLDQLAGRSSSTSSGKADLGKLPKTSLILLAALIGAWVLIILYVVCSRVKKEKK